MTEIETDFFNEKNSTAHGLRIVATGNTLLPDFKSIVPQLESISEFCDETEMSARLATSPDLVIIFVDRPDSISASLVAQWIDQHPLIPFVAIHSSHGEGELRSGSPWPGVVRVYWHKWPFQFEKFLFQKANCRVADWNFPKTASLVDLRMQANKDIDFPVRQKKAGDFVIAVSTDLRVDYEMFECDLTANGFQSIWLEKQNAVRQIHEQSRDEKAADLLLIDANSLTEKTVSRIRELSFNFSDARKLLTLGFPRHQEMNLARELNIDAVLSKPLDRGELAWMLYKLLAVQKYYSPS